MAHTIVMPRFGATMEEGTINSWSVKEGAVIKKGDLLGEIAIEKLTNDLLAEEDGIVLKLIADEGDTLPCGAPILVVGEPGESLDDLAPEPAAEQTPAPTRVEVVAAPAAIAAESAQAPAGDYDKSARITPKALELAEELGIDYHYVKGTGRLGAITREDIRGALETGTARKVAAPVASAPLASETRVMTQMQTTIASAMEASLKNTAQTTISTDLDATAMVQAYQAHKEEYRRSGIKLTYTAILVKLVAAALIEHKDLRTVIQGNSLVTHAEINIGIAVDVPDGLMVPNIKNVDRKDLRQIAQELEDLGNRARSNALGLDDITGGTLTITNLGMYGIKYFTPVLNPGESGILGVGAVQDVVSVRDGGIFVKPVVNISLTHDHRVVNGAPAARFLQTIQQKMMECATLFNDQE